LWRRSKLLILHPDRPSHSHVSRYPYKARCISANVLDAPPFPNHDSSIFTRHSRAQHSLHRPQKSSPFRSVFRINVSFLVSSFGAEVQVVCGQV
jgi:hypothetical protein